MASGGAPGWGLAQNLQAIWYVTGSKEPDCMIVALGTNDWGSPEVGLQEYVDAYKKVIDYAKLKGVTMVCALPTWNKEENILKPHTDGEWKIAQLRERTKELCLSENLKVFDPTKIGLKPSDFPDGLHMNWHGHQVYVKALVTQMQEWKLWPKNK